MFQNWKDVLFEPSNILIIFILRDFLGKIVPDGEIGTIIN